LRNFPAFRAILKCIVTAGTLTLLATHGWATPFTIIPTFDSTITSLPTGEKSTVEAAINTVIVVYEATFVDPITVNITFASMSSGLGQSNTTLNMVSYSDYINALWVDKTNAGDLAPLANLSKTATTNPVTGTSSILVKNADLKALGLTSYLGNPSGSDGKVSIDFAQTTAAGGSYSVTAVLEHEIDEVLGLGSDLDLAASTNSAYLNYVAPEDLFRYTTPVNGSAVRSYTTSSATAYFSLNGTVELAQFNNPNISTCYNAQTNVDSCGDYGDWTTGTKVQVQDAYGTPGSTPALGVELTALDAIGYDMTATPEPGTWGLFLAGIGVVAASRKERAKG
jgi:hypothetical protein